MPGILAYAIGGAVAGSVYYLLKQMNNDLVKIETKTEVIYRIRNNIKQRRYSAKKLKHLLKTEHDNAFNIWVNLKKNAQKIADAVNEVIQAIRSGIYRGQQLKNLKIARNKLIKEQKKATFIKRQAHKKWDKLRDEYLSAKRQLNSLY